MLAKLTRNQQDETSLAWMWAMVSILLGMALTGCRVTSGLPQTDIVFQVYPADLNAEDVLGFVNADGTGLTIVPHIIGDYGMLPAWSPDGTQIAYRHSHPPCEFRYYGTIAVVGEQEVCRRSLGGNGRVRWMPDGSAVLVDIGEQQTTYAYRYAVVSVDPEECRVVDEIYVTPDGAADPDLSSSGLLAFWRNESIVVVDLATQEERVVGEGVVPSWSPDGQWLAYTGADGIYIVRADGTDRRRVLEYCTHCHTRLNSDWDDWPPLPEWSPDGRWLVYHREGNGEYAIYKLNLETGEEVLIAEGGLNPDWRQAPAATPSATP